MKMKKSELIALLKEEIKETLTMMDDPNVGEEPESFKVMDKVAAEMERMAMTEIDEAISMISNYLVTTHGDKDPLKLAVGGMSMLGELGFKPITQHDVKAMLDDEDDEEDEMDMEPMMEKTEKLTEAVDLDSFMQVMGAIKQMMPMIAAMGAPVAIGLFWEALKKQMGTPERDGGEM